MLSRTNEKETLDNIRYVGSPDRSGVLFFLNFFSFLSIPFPLAVNTPAVLLTVKVHRFGDMPAVRVAFPQVGVKKGNAFFRRDLVPDYFYQIVFLMGTDEQGSSKSIKAFLAGYFCCLGQTELETFIASFLFVPRHPPEVFWHIIALGNC